MRLLTNSARTGSKMLAVAVFEDISVRVEVMTHERIIKTKDGRTLNPANC